MKFESKVSPSYIFVSHYFPKIVYNISMIRPSKGLISFAG